MVDLGLPNTYLYRPVQASSARSTNQTVSHSPHATGSSNSTPQPIQNLHSDPDFGASHRYTLSTHTYTHIHLHIHTYTYSHTHILTYTHTHILTYSHTHILIQAPIDKQAQPGNPP